MHVFKSFKLQQLSVKIEVEHEVIVKISRSCVWDRRLVINRNNDNNNGFVPWSHINKRTWLLLVKLQLECYLTFMYHTHYYYCTKNNDDNNNKFTALCCLNTLMTICIFCKYLLYLLLYLGPYIRSKSYIAYINSTF